MLRLNILTWHTHGSYLHYLTQAPHEFYVLSKPGRPPGYGGRSGHIPWGPNVHDLPVSEARRRRLDCIVFQDDAQYLADQHEFLSETQRRLPKIYIEHDPPRANPVDEPHIVDSADVLLVHVTHFNRLMWHSGRTPTRVIDHGVIDPGYRYTGELERGLVVVNHLARRGRRLGRDVFLETRKTIPLDLVGMGAEEAGGLREVLHAELPAFAARYRFFFNPIRYTSMGLAVIESMLAGLPIVALATTEMATVIKDGVNGHIDSDLDRLVLSMKQLLEDKAKAAQLGIEARRTALERFNIERFVRDWNEAFAEVTGLCSAPSGRTSRAIATGSA
jgi:hypothetical protein